MASRNIDDLTPDLRDPVRQLIERCRSRGIEMRPYQTLRDPFEQARLWRQSRTTQQILAKIAEFRAGGGAFLADCLERVGPQHGDPVTNATPGLSWHQWGEGMDCFWVVDGGAEWSTQRKINGLNGYRVYADEAVSLGLTAGGFFTSLKDWPHVQLRAAGAPLGALTLRQINDTMLERFGP